MKKSTLLVSILLTAMAGSLTADIIVDSLDNTDNFTGAFGGVTVTDNGGSGIVSIIKTASETDSGVTWQLGGGSGGAMSLSEYTDVSITGASAINGGYFSVQIMLFDQADAYIAEPSWITSTQSTTKQSVNLDSFIASAGHSGSNVGSWSLRIRVNDPWTTADSGFEFDEITVTSIPEPGTMFSMLLGLSGIALWRHRRT